MTINQMKVCQYISLLPMAAKGVRSLIDSYTLAAMKVFYPQWETVGIELLERCVTKDGLTDVGREIWQSMVNDMGATVAGGSHA
ncbi:hypothetical protein V9G66_002126 [Escherichia coli]|nr:hypothetical protein [Escherichia coli]